MKARTEFEQVMWEASSSVPEPLPDCWKSVVRSLCSSEIGISGISTMAHRASAKEGPASGGSRTFDQQYFVVWGACFRLGLLTTRMFTRRRLGILLRVASSGMPSLFHVPDEALKCLSDGGPSFVNGKFRCLLSVQAALVNLA